LQTQSGNAQLIRTPGEKQHYLLTVNLNQIHSIKEVGARYDNKKYNYVMINVLLSNISKDTLKYLNMTCSWNEAFTTSNKAIKIAGWSCDSNFPTVYAIPPGVSKTFTITLEIPKEQQTNNFRVGFYLIKFRGYSAFLDFDKFLHSKKSYENCLLWSNEIPIPK